MADETRSAATGRERLLGWLYRRWFGKTRCVPYGFTKRCGPTCRCWPEEVEPSG